MRALRILCVCVALAIPIAAIVAACSDPLNDLGGPTTPTTQDAAPIGNEDAPVVVVPPEDAPSAFIDVGTPDTFVPRNPYDASDRPDGGLQVTPGVITCGGGSCNAFAGNQCCTGDDGGACLSTGVPCGAGGSMTCDEAADCLVGNACCGALSTATADGGPYLSSTCAASCAATPPGIQMCRTNGECGDASPCVVQTCSDGLTYEMCGVVTPGAGDGGFTCTPN